MNVRRDGGRWSTWPWPSRVHGASCTRIAVQP